MSRERSRQHEVRVGLLLLLAAGVFAWLAIQIGAFQGFGGAVHVTLRLPDAAGLVNDSAVKVAGVGVGSVRDLRVDGDEAVATLVLRSEAGLRRDVRAEVRARSLLGEKYVALVPQGQDAALLRDGDQILDVRPSVEIDQLIAAIGPLLQGVDPEDIAGLIHSLATIAGAVSDGSDDLTGDVRGLISALKEVAGIAPALKEDVPALLSETRQAVRHLDATVQRVDRAVAAFTPLADRAGETLDRVDEAASAVPPAVEQARGMMTAIEPGADDLGRALESSDEAIAHLERLLAKLDAIDQATIHRLLRQEGILVRLKEEKVEDGP